jgi:hypothetical protein
MGLSFTIADGPRHRSHSQVRVPRDTWSHFTVSNSRLPQPGGPGPRIYILQEQSGPIIPPGTGFPFRRYLRLAGLPVEVFDPASTRVRTRVKVKVTLRLAVYRRSGRLGVKPLETHDQRFFFN